MISFRLLDFQPTENPNSKCKGYFTLELSVDGNSVLEIHGCALFYYANTNVYKVWYPQRKRENKYIPLLEITDKALRDEIERSVVESWEQYREENKPQKK